MDEQSLQGFRKFLKQSGKKDHVVEGLIHEVERFEEFLAGHTKGLDQAGELDIPAYIDQLETQKAGSAGKMVRGIALYFKYQGKTEIALAFSKVRESAIQKTRKSFPLSEFLGINPDYIEKLAGLGIHTAEQVLECGNTPEQREELSTKSGVPLQAVLEVVKLADLSRLNGVKAIRTRLYYDSGADSVEKLASFEPDDLLRVTAEFVHKTGFEGIAPLPKEVRSTIATARILPKIVRW